MSRLVMPDVRNGLAAIECSTWHADVRTRSGEDAGDDIVGSSGGPPLPRSRAELRRTCSRSNVGMAAEPPKMKTGPNNSLEPTATADSFRDAKKRHRMSATAVSAAQLSRWASFSGV